MHDLLFCAHTLCMNYVINTFLLVSSSVRCKQLLCFVHGQGQKENKNLQQRKLSGFITIPLYILTMLMQTKRWHWHCTFFALVYYTFCTVLHCTALTQSESSNFFMHIIIQIIKILFCRVRIRRFKCAIDFLLEPPKLI